MSRRRLPHLTAVAVGVLLGGALAPSATAAHDLRATTVNGPGQVYVGSTVHATIKIDNLGDPLIGGYVAQVVLSEDVVIDASDTVVGSVTSDVLGSQTVGCTIPFGLPDVPHVWGLHVMAPGDDDVTNNWNVGPFVNVFYVDLALDDPSPITVAVNAFGPVPDPIPVTVNNVGTPSSIVVFDVEELTPADWLMVDAPNSFAVGGFPGNDVFLRIDHAGLVPGVYTTTLRFRNSYYMDDYEDLDLTLVVGRAVFKPGDKIFGQIAGAGDIDELEFDAVAGMKLVVRVRSSSGDIVPKLSLVDPDGYVDDVVVFKHSKQLVKKLLKAKGSGRYVLRVEGKKGTKGGYAIKTHRKMPKSANAHTRKFKGLGYEEAAVAPALLLPGGTLEYAIAPNSKFEGPLGLSVKLPAGSLMDLSGAMDVLPNGTVKIEGLDNEDACGCFELWIDGFGGGPKEKVKVMVLPTQPQQGKGKVYVD